MPGIDPPVNTTRCNFALSRFLGHPMFDSLICIQNGRVIYQGISYILSGESGQRRATKSPVQRMQKKS